MLIRGTIWTKNIRLQDYQDIMFTENWYNQYKTHWIDNDYDLVHSAEFVNITFPERLSRHNLKQFSLMTLSCVILFLMIYFLVLLCILYYYCTLLFIHLTGIGGYQMYYYYCIMKSNLLCEELKCWLQDHSESLSDPCMWSLQNEWITQMFTPNSL